MKEQFEINQNKQVGNTLQPPAPPRPTIIEDSEMVVPFSNGTESMVYSERNCHRCSNYENESRNEADAKCKMAYHIDLGNILGELPFWVAKKVGCDVANGSVTLHSRCKEFSKINSPSD